MHYNAVLRKFPAGVLKEMKGNKYVTTVHCINSAILKLSRATPMNPRFVYRGSSKMQVGRRDSGREESEGKGRERGSKRRSKGEWSLGADTQCVVSVAQAAADRIRCKGPARADEHRRNGLPVAHRREARGHAIRGGWRPVDGAQGPEG